MAEVLLRVQDKSNPDDPAADAQCTKRGDVIVVCADGHPWTKAERTAPYWRIIKLPGIDPTDLDVLTRPEMEAEPQDGRPARLLRARMHALDLAALPAAVRAWLQNESAGRAPTISVTRTRVQVLAWVMRKT